MAEAARQITDDRDYEAREETLLGLRPLPTNIEAEKSLLGGILANNIAYEAVSEFLRPEHFGDPINGQIFGLCAQWIERGKLASPVVLKTYFEQNNTLAEIGGTKYLAELAASAVTIINCNHYGQIILDLWQRRKLIEMSWALADRAYGGSEDDDGAVSLIESAEQSLFDMAHAAQPGGGFDPFREASIAAIHQAESAYKRDGSLTGTTTGLTDLDKILAGLQPSDLLVLAGRPSMGKTQLAVAIARNAAQKHHATDGKEGAVVGFFSLEMSGEQLASRIHADVTSIESDRMRKGEIGIDEFEYLERTAQDQLYDLPLYIDATSELTLSAIRTRARRLKRQRNLGLIIVDYLQLISAPKGRRAESRVQEVSEMTRGLKILAKELNVPVVVLSQLSRAVEQREDKRPQLSDLRESGSIEQDADVVMFIYREEYYLDRSKPREIAQPSKKEIAQLCLWEQRKEAAANLAEVIVAKQRNGPVGTIKLFFDGRYSRIRTWDHNRAQSPTSTTTNQDELGL